MTINSLENDVCFALGLAQCEGAQHAETFYLCASQLVCFRKTRQGPMYTAETEANAKKIKEKIRQKFSRSLLFGVNGP